MIDGERVDLLPTFTQLLSRLPAGPSSMRSPSWSRTPAARRGACLPPWPGGRILPLSLDKVAPILTALLSVWGSAEPPQDPSSIRRRRATLPISKAVLPATWSWSAARASRRSPRSLPHSRHSTAGGASFLVPRNPSSLPAVRVDWLQMLARTGFGGVLADDMGLGKTVQLLAHLAIEKEAGRLDAGAGRCADKRARKLARRGPAFRAWSSPFSCTRGAQGEGAVRHRGHRCRRHLLSVACPRSSAPGRPALERRGPGRGPDHPQSPGGDSLAAFALDARQRIALSGTPVENTSRRRLVFDAVPEFRAAGRPEILPVRYTAPRSRKAAMPARARAFPTPQTLHASPAQERGCVRSAGEARTGVETAN